MLSHERFAPPNCATPVRWVRKNSRWLFQRGETPGPTAVPGRAPGVRSGRDCAVQPPGAQRRPLGVSGERAAGQSTAVSA